MTNPSALEPVLDLNRSLQDALARLDAGDVESARALAHGVCAAAERVNDRRAEAHALTCLANCDRQVAQFRRAQESSQRAGMLFRELDDLAGEVTALTIFAHVSATLGRLEEAVEAALLSTQLADLLPASRQHALAHNYLGIAYFYSKNFDQANAAFERSAAIARQCEPALSSFQPLLNQALGEVVRCMIERFHTGVLPSTERLRRFVDGVLPIAHEQGLINGLDVATKTLWSSVRGFLACWEGNLELAERHAADAAGCASKYGTPTLLTCIVLWNQAEICWRKHDLQTAGQFITEFMDMSVLVEHEMFVGFAHMLASQVYVLQGNPDAALLELRRLRLREEAIRSESLESRARAVAWQMQTRTTERERQRLELSSRDFERLSLEDSLTGIGNRRWFEQRLDKLLSGSADGETICVALLDVDSFKQVNDSFSHLVGDEVLKRIGQILTAHVREGDAPVRLAGDEFVVAFRCSYAVAQSICERVTEAVEQFAWDEVANGLQVGISVGLTQASAGDTVAALLARSDAAMYASKPAGAASKDEELHRPQVRRN